MDGMNRVILLGGVGSDPELHFTTAGHAVLNLRLATTESWFDKGANERKERTDWHSVTVWGKRAEGLAKVVRKGARVMVEGRLQTSEYQDREGNKRQRTEVVASNVILCSEKKAGAGATHATATPGSSSGGSGDDLPF